MVLFYILYLCRTNNFKSQAKIQTTYQSTNLSTTKQPTIIKPTKQYPTIHVTSNQQITSSQPKTNRQPCNIQTTNNQQSSNNLSTTIQLLLNFQPTAIQQLAYNKKHILLRYFEFCRSEFHSKLE